MKSTRIDMTGLKVNMLQVVKAVKKEDKPKKVYWECVCDCGKTIIIDGSCLRRKNKTISCGCQRIKIVKEKMWKGYKEISKSYWSRLQAGALERKLKFEITIEEAWELFIKQNKKCGLTGVEIGFSTSIKRKKQDQTASLDRINSQEGYIKSNIMWVHKFINRLKTNISNEDLIHWCRLVSNYNS